MAKKFYGEFMDNGSGTGYITNGNRWGHPHAARVRCPDGALRIVRLRQQADTYFSWPARGRAVAGGRTVSGYVSGHADTGELRFYLYQAPQ